MSDFNATQDMFNGFTSAVSLLVGTVNGSVSAMEDLQTTFQDCCNKMEAAGRLFASLMSAGAGRGSGGSSGSGGNTAGWRDTVLPVYTGSGGERFEQEAQSASRMLEQLSRMQDAIAERAFNAVNIVPPEAAMGLNSMAVRIDAIRERMQQISSNRMNMGTDEANTELEKMRAQFNEMIQVQNELNNAMDHHDMSAANAAYLRLSQLVAGTEINIRDNVDEQGRFNNVVKQGAKEASALKNIVSKTLGKVKDIFSMDNAVEFVSEGMKEFEARLQTENKLMAILANRPGRPAEYTAKVSASADQAEAGIRAVFGNMDGVEIGVTSRTEALRADFDSITAKAEEIQAKGIYEDDVMLTGAVELSAHFKDADAITMMMETLADYAVGESGGGEIDGSGMAAYAAELGKVMSGSYDDMTEKGFRFTEAQKAIIEGDASREQIISTLGEEYLSMSSDMQAAAAISQVVQGSWAGLYETMSAAPQGKIIQLNNAWGSMQQTIGGQLYPCVIMFVDAIINNWGTIQKVFGVFGAVLQTIGGILGWLFGGIMNVASAIIDNWSCIAPVIWGIIAALIVYNAVMGIGWLTTLQDIASKGKGIAVSTAQAVATFASTVAQQGLNAAIASCPLTWLIIGIIAIVAVILLLCNMIAKATGIAGSGFGVLCGSVAVALAFIGNLVIGAINGILQFVWTLFVEPFIGIIEWILNVVNGGFQGFGGAVANLIGNIISWFLSLGKVVTKIIDAVFGTDWTSGLESLQDSVLGWGKNEDAITLDRTAQEIDYRFEYDKAFDAGASFGDGIADAVSNFSLTDLFGNEEDDYLVIPEQESWGEDDVNRNLDSISSDTGNIADTLDVSQEDLKYLRDLAEQEQINRYTLAEVNVDMTGMQNTIKNGGDLDGFISNLTNAVNEAVNNISEGVHE